MTNAQRIPSPPELLPGLPDAVIDLRTDAGVQLVKGQWRYSDTRVEEIDFVEVGPDLGPSGEPNRTYDVLPHAGSIDFGDSGWDVLPPADTERRLSTGRVCFNWYRIKVRIPQKSAILTLPARRLFSKSSLMIVPRCGSMAGCRSYWDRPAGRLLAGLTHQIA